VAHFRLKAYLASALAASAMTMTVGCKKEQPAPAVVEETPMESVPMNTDTSAVLQEEPALSQVGGSTTKSSSNRSAAAPEGIVQNGRFVVQVSVFKSARKAGNLVETLAGQGYPAYVAEVQDPTPEMPGTWHRVRVGTFRTLSDARSFGDNTLRPMGYDFWVDKKSMDNVGMRDGGYSSGSGSSAGSAADAPSSYSSPSTYSEPAPSTYSEPAPSNLSPSVAEPPAPSTPEPSAPASSGWSTSPSEPTEPPAPESNSGWGNATESATPPATPVPEAVPESVPADTGTPKLDDW
jgi:SPOR domain